MRYLKLFEGAIVPPKPKPPVKDISDTSGYLSPEQVNDIKDIFIDLDYNSTSFKITARGRYHGSVEYYLITIGEADNKVVITENLIEMIDHLYSYMNQVGGYRVSLINDI